MNIENPRVGQLTPSQLLYTYGVGAIVDLPQLAVLVMGLDSWTIDPSIVREISEPRLLRLVRIQMGGEVQQLLSLPVSREDETTVNPFDPQSKVGIPVSIFPRWLVCPSCRTLARIDSGLFELKVDAFRPDRTHFEHVNCNKPGKKPTAVPARFMVVCENGHLDDFPWIEYAHYFATPCATPLLTLYEYGPSGEARDLQVKCLNCSKERVMAQAFGKDNREHMPQCTGRRPHLRDYDEACPNKMRAIILGASNLWFPVVFSTIAIPSATDELALLVEREWALLQHALSPEILKAFWNTGQLGTFSKYSLDQVWGAVERKRSQESDTPSSTEPELLDLKLPEWQIFSSPSARPFSPDFRLRSVTPPSRFKSWISQVVLVERMREVKALVGFTRIDAPDELTQPGQEREQVIVPLARSAMKWAPAVEVRGEGIFIQFNEVRMQQWLAAKVIRQYEAVFWNAHTAWRRAHGIEPPEENYPGLRYVFLHTFAHALMRQLAIECGYSQASVRERIYSRDSNSEGGPMAGVLIYTAAPDSEGTLGGLVSQGESQMLERHIARALEDAQLCSSDPTCAEHQPGKASLSIHGAACHACLFAPETSCERGNRYLDRALLTKTIRSDALALFN